MPPRRSRNSSGPAAKGSQKTLSFISGVTKPSTYSSLKDAKSDSKNSPLSQALASKPELADISTGHVTSEAAVEQQTKIEFDREKTAEEVKAEKVTNAQIRKYWREREADRKAPRVHQEDLGVEEKILRLFDMSSQYGVCSFSIAISHSPSLFTPIHQHFHPAAHPLPILESKSKSRLTLPLNSPVSA
jgi:DNA polymerase delta subunit 4